MIRDYFWLLLAGSLFSSGCQFQNKSELLLPTAPTSASGGTEISAGSSGGSGSGSQGSGGSGGSGSSSASSSGFSGSWGSPTLPGLPQISSCTDLEWEISSQSGNSIAGVVSATCGGIADITANLTGQMESDDTVKLTAKGSAVALGLTCGFDLTGVGHRESSDAWRLDYEGTTCFGKVSGSELLKRNTPPPPPAPSPAPQPGPAPSPSAPATGSVPCAGNTGKQIVECVEKAYPSLLAAGVSLDTRTANMKFLRDRVIETCKCKGMDVGLNLKRGGPSISTDFLVWRHGGLTEGVDIGAGYDDTKKPLNLIWFTYGPPNYGHPYYKDYGPATCN
jgi:hypothetical protein